MKTARDTVFLEDLKMAPQLFSKKLLTDRKKEMAKIAKEKKKRASKNKKEDKEKKQKIKKEKKPKFEKSREVRAANNFGQYGKIKDWLVNKVTAEFSTLYES